MARIPDPAEVIAARKEQDERELGAHADHVVTGLRASATSVQTIGTIVAVVGGLSVFVIEDGGVIGTVAGALAAAASFTIYLALAWCIRGLAVLIEVTRGRPTP